MSLSDADVHICFLQRYWEREDRSWIDECALNPGHYPIAHLALQSFAAAFFSRRHRSTDLRYSPLKYAQALTALRSALQRDDVSCSFDILAATTALYRYETIACTSRAAFIKHAGGISKVTELSGPECFFEHPSRALLKANAPRIVHEAYFQRTQTFLAQESWKRPEHDTQAEANDFTDLFDIWARVAGLSQLITFFLIGFSARNSDAWQVRCDLNRLLEDLGSWHRSRTTSQSFTPAEVEKTDLDVFYSDEIGQVFESYLQYPTLCTAMSLNIYRALRITVLEWTFKLDHPTWWAGEDRERMVEVPSIRSLATDIARSLHAHLPSQGGETEFEMFTLLFSARCACKPFHRRSREVRWIEKTLAEFADTRGFELGRDLACMDSLQLPGPRSKGTETVRWPEPRASGHI